MITKIHLLGTSVLLLAHLASALPPTQHTDSLRSRQEPATNLPQLSHIARCPTPETTTAVDGKNFTICQGTDMNGGNAQETKDIATEADCVNLCATTANCAQAAYDTQDRICYIKLPMETNAMFWLLNSRFTTIKLAAPRNPSMSGQWSDIIRLPVIPVGGFVVPAYPESSRVLFFSSWGATTWGGASGLTQFADFDYLTGKVSQREVANTKHDMFCPGISTLEDGRVMISGGSNAEAVSFYDPATNEFTKGPDMIIPRGYQSSCTTSEGKIFELGGSFSGKRGGKSGELYDPATGKWTALTEALTDPMLTVDDEGHAWLYSWTNGSVFQAGPSKAQNWYDTVNNGANMPAGTRSGGDAMCAANVMYEPGKILSAGGAATYTDSPGLANSHITTITEAYKPSVVEEVANMTYPRGYPNAVVLPDGTVLVTGGQQVAEVFTDKAATMYPELFNPVTKEWTILAPESVPRTYHSISLLLPDATVFSGGGGLCYGRGSGCDRTVDHQDGQIFSPPYLFNADGSAATRPEISAVAETNVTVGGTLTVTCNTAKASLVLIRIGSATHSINTDQRRVPLQEVKEASAPDGKTSYTATLPKDSGVLIPGAYYLFVVNDQGVPSISRTVQVVRSKSPAT
ncbi:galactose oxidase precursor [Drepanopeziza brunnea f. sp. 'multigermtubi' MB_m1]|uniref:Galactose oxidase n=1 Tax=Marssonina brunnea f. sp. multigermtubi (strain MB_m1) TaxID=1072389 RepID=K1XJ48_MARBU|nr:galactose oxidase precursor [Drepanopeziza brunnea f. sp. 'multigermtubi' MB_m1]EKD20708.1 galactose oxidase precursor [Drepanopeziza brunnea f. sp. 'multigermtubi' MB_m1]